MITNHEHKGIIRTLMENDKAGAWIFRLLILIAILYLQLNYVPKSDFNTFTERADAMNSKEQRERLEKLNEIAITVARIDERLKRFEERK